jgi:hypothetical protein
VDLHAFLRRKGVGWGMCRKPRGYTEDLPWWRNRPSRVWQVIRLRKVTDPWQFWRHWSHLRRSNSGGLTRIFILCIFPNLFLRISGSLTCLIPLSFRKMLLQFFMCDIRKVLPLCIVICKLSFVVAGILENVISHKGTLKTIYLMPNYTMMSFLIRSQLNSLSILATEHTFIIVDSRTI